MSMPPLTTSWRLISILPSHTHLGLPSGLFPSDLLTKILYGPLMSPIRATCPVHLILLDLTTRIKNLVSSREHKAPRYVVFSTLLLPYPTFELFNVYSVTSNRKGGLEPSEIWRLAIWSMDEISEEESAVFASPFMRKVLQNLVLHLHSPGHYIPDTYCSKR